METENASKATWLDLVRNFTLCAGDDNKNMWRKLLTTLLRFIEYIILMTIISAGLVVYMKTQIYPNYLWDMPHRGFWFLECGTSGLLLISLLIAVVFIAVHWQDCLSNYKYYIFDVLAIITIYCLVCPLIGSNPIVFGETAFNLFILWIILNFVGLCTEGILLLQGKPGEKVGQVFAHLGYVVGGTIVLFLLCYFKPRLYLYHTEVMEYPYILFALVFVFILSILNGRTTAGKARDWFFTLGLYLMTSVFAGIQALV